MIRVEYDLVNQSYKVTDGDDVTHYSDEKIEELLNGLQSAGYKLPGDEYQRGFLAAQSAHLEDLRRITFLEDKDGRV